MSSLFMRALSRRAVSLGLPLLLTTAVFGQSAPSGVWASAGNGTVNLSWNVVPGARYSIYRGTSAGHEGTTPIATGGGTTYQDTVTNGTAYFYKVAATYANTKSPLSAEVSCTAGAPMPGTSLVAAFSASTKITLNYSAVPTATFYRIFRYNNVVGYQLVGTTSALSFVDTTVQGGQEYGYSVTAGNAATDGPAGSTVTAIAGDAPLSSPTVAWTSPTANSNNVTWTPVPGALGYVVYRSTTPNGEGAQPYALVGSYGFTDNSVTKGTTYYYKSAAFDYSGTGATGPETSGTPGSTGLPGGLITAVAGKTSISLAWKPVAGATSYYIVRGDGNYYNNQTYITRTTATQFTDSAVVAGGTYDYSAIPATVNGIGTVQSIASAKVGDAPAGIPAGLNATSQSTSVQLNWNNVSGAYAYAIYRCTAGTPALYDLVYGTNNYTDTGAKAGTLYTYAVASVNPDSESPLSGTITGQANEAALPAPVATATVSGANISIFWSLVPGALSYNVFRQIYGGNYLCLATGVVPGAGATNGAYTDTTAPASEDCTYFVCAVNHYGIGVSSNDVQAGTDFLEPGIPSGSFASQSTGPGGVNAINLSVNPVPGVNSYNVYRGTKTGGEGVIPYAENVGSNYQDIHVTTGVTYYYTFTSVDQDGQSAFSPEVACTWGATPLPATTVTAYAGATSIVLAWAPVSGATGYDVFRSLGNAGYVLYQQNVTTTTLTDTDVASNESVNYQVYAVGTKGAGNRSNTVTARSASSAPSTTTGVFGISTGSGNVISWNAVAGANTYYNVFRSTSSGMEGLVPIAAGVGNGGEILSFTDETAVSGDVYYYTVSTVTPDNQSAQSAQVSVKTKSPQLVAPTLQSTSSTGKVALSWTPIPGAAGYNLFRTDPLLGWVLYQQSVTGTTFTDTSVVEGVQYDYYVAAVAANGMGITSNTVAGNP